MTLVTYARVVVTIRRNKFGGILTDQIKLRDTEFTEKFGLSDFELCALCDSV